MLGDSLPPNVPVLHDDDELPPVRRVTRRFGVVASEVLRGMPKPSSRPPERHDSVPPVGITIPPPPPRAAGHAAFAVMSEARALIAVMSRLNRTGAVFATAIVGLLAVLVVKGRAVTSDSASATATPAATVTATATPTEDAHREAFIASPLPQDEAPMRAEALAHTVELAFSANVATAQFRVDGGPWLSNPSTQRVAEDDRDHRIEARAEGYFPRFATARFTQDTLLEVALERIVAWSAPAKPAKRTDAPPPRDPEQADVSTPPSAGDERRGAISFDVFRGGQAPVRPIERRSPYE